MVSRDKHLFPSLSSGISSGACAAPSQERANPSDLLLPQSLQHRGALSLAESHIAFSAENSKQTHGPGAEEIPRAYPASHAARKKLLFSQHSAHHRGILVVGRD